jgi:hypothetical protein
MQGIAVKPNFKDHELRQLILDSFLSCCPLKPKPRELYAREWAMEPEEIDAIELKSCPSLVLNMIISSNIAKQIGFPEKGIRECFWTGNLWLLDIPSKFADSGVILPIKDPARRNVKYLQVYRHVKDQKPFIVGNVKYADTRSYFR